MSAVVSIELDSPSELVVTGGGALVKLLIDATANLDELRSVLRACDSQKRRLIAVRRADDVLVPLDVFCRSAQANEQYRALWLDNDDGNDGTNNDNDNDDGGAATPLLKLVDARSSRANSLTSAGSADASVRRPSSTTATTTTTTTHASATMSTTTTVAGALNDSSEAGVVSAVQSSLPDVSDVFYVVELRELQIGSWKIISKMKGEITLIIDELKQNVQYRWRRVSLKKKTFATKVIQFGLRAIKAAGVQVHGNINAALALSRTATTAIGDVGGGGGGGSGVNVSGAKRKLDDALLTTNTIATTTTTTTTATTTATTTESSEEPLCSLVWMVELAGPPQFFSGGEQPMTKTTAKLKRSVVCVC